jgi:HPt (histidine-containing phosphotransfer) domain-containing protein
MNDNKALKVLNAEATLTRFGGDQELYAEMASILLDDAPQLAQETKDAVGRRDAAAIRAKAHALKGLVLGCGGERAGQAAQTLEDAGNRGELHAVESQFATLEVELQQLFHALRAQVASGVTA